MERYIRVFVGGFVGLVVGMLVQKYLGLSAQWGIFPLLGAIGGAVAVWTYWKRNLFLLVI